jgi:hypothetical protein
LNRLTSWVTTPLYPGRSGPSRWRLPGPPHTRARALLRREHRAIRDLATAAGLEVELGMVGILAGDFTADWALIENARRAAGRLNNLPLRARAAALIALADYTSGAIDAARAGIDSVAALTDSLPDHSLTPNLEATVYLGWTEMFLERFHPALDHLERGLRLARRTGQEHILPYLLSGIACAHQWLGRLNTAACWADDAVAAAELTGGDELRAVTYTVQALVASRQGDVELAHGSGERAVAAAGSGRDWWSAAAAAIHGEVRIQRGADPTECLRTIMNAAGGPDLEAIDPGSKPSWYRSSSTPSSPAVISMYPGRGSTGCSRRSTRCGPPCRADPRLPAWRTRSPAGLCSVSGRVDVHLRNIVTKLGVMRRRRRRPCH